MVCCGQDMLKSYEAGGTYARYRASPILEIREDRRRESSRNAWIRQRSIENVLLEAMLEAPRRGFMC